MPDNTANMLDAATLLYGTAAPDGRPTTHEH